MLGLSRGVVSPFVFELMHHGPALFVWSMQGARLALFAATHGSNSVKQQEMSAAAV